MGCKASGTRILETLERWYLEDQVEKIEYAPPETAIALGMQKLAVVNNMSGAAHMHSLGKAERRGAAGQHGRGKASQRGPQHRLEVVLGIPQQADESACGVFTCAFAELLSRGIQPPFEFSHVSVLYGVVRHLRPVATLMSARCAACRSLVFPVSCVLVGLLASCYHALEYTDQLRRFVVVVHASRQTYLTCVVDWQLRSYVQISGPHRDQRTNPSIEHNPYPALGCHGLLIFIHLIMAVA